MTIGRKFLVTGSSGFIGQNLVKFLTNAGYEVITWSRENCDLRDQSAVQRKIEALKPDIIIHLAAGAVSDHNDLWTKVSEEVAMLSNLVESMPTHCRFIHAGSVAEYGYAGYFDELAPCRPDTSYGAAKLACTHYALATRLTHHLDIRVARLFGVYGPGESARRLLPSLVDNLRAGKTIALSDGLQLRDFVHVDDVAATLRAFAEISDPPGPLINIGTGVGVTVQNVCEIVADILNADPALMEFGAVARRIVDQDILVAKTGRLAKFHGVPSQRWLSKEQVETYICALAEKK